MNHPGDLLSAYLDGELAPDESAHLEAHLAGCGACRGELEATAGTRSLLRRLPELDPPPGLVARALARPRKRVLPVAWAAAAAAAVALGFVSAGGPEQPAPPTVDRLVQAHAASTGNDPVSGLTPIAVPVSFSR